MFDKAFLEITSRCNLACPFCPPTGRPAEDMPPERFERLLSRLEGRARVLYFHLKGEPLLHPALGDYLAAAGERGFSVHLTTNGSLLAQRARVLLGAPALGKLSVSLHSQAGSAALETYWRGLEAFLDLHRERPAFPVSLRLWNREPGGLPPETAALWELLARRYPAAGDWGSAEGWSSRELRPRVYLNQAERFDWPGSAGPADEGRGFCHGLGNQVGVLVDGSLVPCCLDGEGRLALGNLLDAPLEELLASPRARAMREGFARRELVEPLCRGCGFRRKFNRRAP